MPEATATSKTPSIKSPRGRLSYPNLFQPKPKMDNPSELHYQAVFIFDKEAQATPEYARMKEAASAAAYAKWGNDIPANLRSPFRQGDGKKDGYGPEVVYINTSSNNKPGCVNQRMEPITDSAELYAGCYVRASLTVYAYDRKGNKGVAFGLRNVQKLGEGTPLGNVTRPEDDFEPTEVPETSGTQAGAGGQARPAGRSVF